MTLGRLGVWYGLDRLDAAGVRDFARTVERLGYAALWYPEARGYEAMERAFHERDLYVRIAGDTLVVAPPLIATEQHFSEIRDKIAAVLGSLS